jgi:hypothetical protein
MNSELVEILILLLSFLFGKGNICSNMKFKMAATAGLTLTFDPMGKMFQNASSLKPLGQLKPNCPVQFGFNHICSF